MPSTESERTGVHKFIWTYTWIVIALGIIMIAVGESQTRSQSANGSGKQMLFDLIGIIGFILIIGGVAVFFKKRKSNKE